MRKMPSARPAHEAFLDCLAEPAASQLRARADLAERLDAVLSEAKASWPQLATQDAAFLRHLGEHLAKDEPFEALDKVAAADLYLACGCAHGEPAAIAAFKRTLWPALRAAVRLKASHEQVDDLCQQLMEKLFVASAERPATIGKYSGQGKLSTWIQVVAIRHVQEHLRKQHRRAKAAPGAADSGHDRQAEMLIERAIASDDPELETLKQRYRKELKQAFQRAFAELSVRQRNLLRQEFLDGLSIDQLGKMYGVHRATAARWRVACRATLLERTHQILASEFKLRERDMGSIVAMIESQLDVSLSRLLRHNQTQERSDEP